MDSVHVEWNGKNLDRALDGAERGLRIAGELVLQRARAVTPNDEGTLERSGVVSFDKPSMTVGVSFDTPYAVRQHEDGSLRHQDGRTDKYLERPWRASAAECAQILATQIRKALGT